MPRRRFRRFKRSFRRRLTKPKLVRGLRAYRSGHIQHFVRTVDYGSSVITSALPWNQSFRLNDLPNYTEFTSLFDAYTIRGVKVTFFPNQVDSEIGGAGGSVPRITCVKDYDDGTNLTAESDALQYTGCKVWEMNRVKSIYIRPLAAQVVWNGGVASGYSQARRNTWIDANNPGVIFYGLKGTASTFPANYQITIYAKFYISCKQTR